VPPDGQNKPMAMAGDLGKTSFFGIQRLTEKGPRVNLIANRQMANTIGRYCYERKVEWIFIV